MKKIIRLTTIPGSMKGLLEGQLNYINQYHEVIGISGNGRVLKEVEKNEGIRTIAVDMTRRITPIKDIQAVIKIYKIFKKENPYIVHSHTPKAGTLGMIAAKLAGVPHRLHTIAGLPLLEAKGVKRKLLNIVEKITYKCATLVLPNSYGLKAIIINEKFCSEKKLKVIASGSSNGINTNYFDKQNISEQKIKSLNEQLKLKPSDTKLLFIGRLVSDKGINELVEAFVNVNINYSDLKLILVGRRESSLDPLKSETELLIKKNINIIETGHVDDVRPYIALSDILVFPSYREGFPNVVLQASCMELPCIVSDINGCNEIITDNFNGLVIPPKSVKAIEEAIIDLHTNPNKIKFLAQNSRENIVTKYKREIVWKEILELYDKL